MTGAGGQGPGARAGVRDFLEPLEESAAPHAFVEGRPDGLCECGGGRLHPIHAAAFEAAREKQLAAKATAAYQIAYEALIAAKASAVKPVKRAKRTVAQAKGGAV